MSGKTTPGSMQNRMNIINNKLGQKLHKQASLGQALSRAEQRQLEAWYKQMDDEEAAWLAQLPPLPEVAQVQAQIDQTLVEIARMAHKTRQVRRHTEKLRRENRSLEKQLAHQSDTKAA